MTPTNWLRVKEVFGDALERPPLDREEFIRRAAAGDPALLDQLLLLLRETERETDLLSRPVLADAAAVTQGETPRFAPSAFLARRFRIVRFIARGGMGEVYEAEDAELGGRVALKAIRQLPSAAIDLRSLFKREIQLARRVTHPNVCRIFDLAQHDDPRDTDPVLLLSMELLEGQSLAEFLQAKGRLAPAGALPLIEKIAAGLQAIHDAGIVHGDLKPGNVMLVQPPGETAPHPRVMDFGMAYAVEPGRGGAPDPATPAGWDPAQSRPAAGPPRSRSGLIGGTPEYFAPEQANGAPATIATDIYAFGLVIAEMLGIPRPGTTSAKDAKDANDAKDAKDARIPNGWSRELRRALDPDPARRHSRAADLANAFRAAAELPSRRRRMFLLAGSGALVLLVAAKRIDSLFRGAVNGLILTESLTMTVECPSPDGKYLAGTSWDTGDLILYDVATGKVRRVTHKNTRIDAVYGGTFGALFTPDGRHIVYVWAPSREFGEIRIIGLDGKGERTLYRSPEKSWLTLLDCSPDGRQVLFHLAQLQVRAGRVGLLGIDDGSSRFLENAPDDTSMRFDADPRNFLFHARNPQAGISEIRRLLPDGTTATVIGQPGSHAFVGWSPDRRQLIFSSDRRGQPGIWAIDTPGQGAPSEPRELAPNSKGWEALGITRTGSFFYRQDSSTIDVYTAELDLAAARTVSPPRRVTERFIGDYSSPHWSEDGRQLVFYSKRERGPVLAFLDLQTRQIRELPVALQFAARPQWVEHGAAVMILGKAANAPRGLYRVDPRTGEAKFFGGADDLQTTFEGAWSSDGRYLYNRFDDFRRGLFRLDLQTRERQILFVPPAGTFMGLENLALSPDGRTLAFHIRSESAGRSSLMLVPTQGGEARPLFSVSLPQRFLFGAFTWTPDSQSLLASSSRPLGHPPADEQISELWHVPVDGAPPRKIEFPPMPVLNLRLNRDGKTIAFESRRGKSEIWVLQRFL